MLTCCWSSKGGMGTTVVAAALALCCARRDPSGALLVDLAGDVPTVLGLPVDSELATAGRRGGAGVADWLQGGARPEEIDVRPGLSLLPRGDGPMPFQIDPLLDAIVDDERSVIVDAGVIGWANEGASDAGLAVAGAATHSLLVLRPCFVALRRAVLAPIRPSGLVLVEEDGRALTAADVQLALGVPVRARVRVTSQIARAVDAGLLSGRLPHSLEHDLRHAA